MSSVTLGEWFNFAKPQFTYLGNGKLQQPPPWIVSRIRCSLFQLEARHMTGAYSRLGIYLFIYNTIECLIWTFCLPALIVSCLKAVYVLAFLIITRTLMCKYESICIKRGFFWCKIFETHAFSFFKTCIFHTLFEDLSSWVHSEVPGEEPSPQFGLNDLCRMVLGCNAAILLFPFTRKNFFLLNTYPTWHCAIPRVIFFKLSQENQIPGAGIIILASFYQ